jgi:hypothetical protein
MKQRTAVDATFTLFGTVTIIKAKCENWLVKDKKKNFYELD